VGDRGGLVHLRVSIEEIPSSATYIADQQIAENHLVANYLVATKKFIKAAGKWLTASQEPNPDRGIH